MLATLFQWLTAFFLWIFHTVFDPIVERCYSQTIVFNCAWEDPRLDHRALDLDEKHDSVMVITSAGCNVLSYALRAKHVYAIDKNPCQNALLDLKIAAIKEFSYEEFWQLFGLGHMEKFSTLHYPRLRGSLVGSSRLFWDTHAHYFDGKGMRSSFYFRGCSGWCAWLIGCYLRLIPGLHSAVMDLINAKTLEEQQHIYDTRVEKKLWNPVLKWVFARSSTLALLNGVPEAQRQLLEQEGGHATIGEFIHKNLEVVFRNLPLADNYFYRVYLTGQYTKDCCPEYLTKEGFTKLKAGAINRVSTHTQTIEEFLLSHPEKDITRFVLLDHMDWMVLHPEILAKEWQAIMDRSPKDAKYLWRSASMFAKFVGETPVTYEGKKTTVGELVEFNKELAAELHPVDRVHTYANFFIADLVSSH